MAKRTQNKYSFGLAHTSESRVTSLSALDLKPCDTTFFKEMTRGMMRDVIGGRWRCGNSGGVMKWMQRVRTHAHWNYQWGGTLWQSRCPWVWGPADPEIHPQLPIPTAGMVFGNQVRRPPFYRSVLLLLLRSRVFSGVPDQLTNSSSCDVWRVLINMKASKKKNLVLLDCLQHLLAWKAGLGHLAKWQMFEPGLVPLT